MLHAGNTGSYFGDSVDLEGDGNQDLCSFSQYDHDECDNSDGDAGLTLAGVWTIDGGNVVPCSDAAAGPLGVPCGRAVWGSDLDIRVTSAQGAERYVNVLMDWDRSGDWGQTVTCVNGDTGPEHVLVDFPVPGGFSGSLSDLGVPSIQILGSPGYVWSRFTLSDSPVGTDDWDGAATFADGETEDYLLLVADETTGAPTPEPRGAGLRLDPAHPNPFNPRTEISFAVERPGPVRVTVHDTAGRRLATLLSRDLGAGRHSLVWQGRADGGRPLPSGTYFVRVVAGGDARTIKVTMLK